MITRAVDLVGQRFGRLIVIERAGTNEKRQALWKCKCDCENVILIPASYLTTGDTQSCGCLRRDMMTKHGGYKHDDYPCWNNMIQRCLNPKNKDFSRYGGRGIKVCDRWLDFNNFMNDMGPRPPKKYSIDRIDNGGDYCPENCRWALPSEQSNNKRNNCVVEYDGKKQTLSQWARELGIGKQTLRVRLKKLHWSISKALTTPVATRGYR